VAVEVEVGVMGPQASVRWFPQNSQSGNRNRGLFQRIGNN
jgi:hypothetical protein